MVLIKMSNKKAKRGNNHNIIVRNYEHYNKAFKQWDSHQGKYISSKAHYQQELDRQGMITEKEADRLGLNTGPKRKDYKITQDTVELINSVAQTADKHGNVKPSDRAIDRLNKNKPKYNHDALPKHYQDKGGFD